MLSRKAQRANILILHGTCVCRLRIMCLLVLLVFPIISRANHANPSSQPAKGVVDFQPGIRIDWALRQVEVEATIILRQGLIELFACTPMTREHESILKIEAQALHLYQGLGLIGLQPGHPTLFDEEKKQIVPAQGDPLEILVRYQRNGVTQTDPIERWMKPSDPKQTIDRLDWVFAGSLIMEDNSLAAESEGTVIALVDFSSALIALPELHSNSNEELWLEPDPEHIPPLQTRCTLIIRPGPIRIRLDSTGRIWWAGKPRILAQTAQIIRKIRQDRPDCPIDLKIESQCPVTHQQTLMKLLDSLEVPQDAIRLSRSDGATTMPHVPQAGSTWLRRILASSYPPDDWKSDRPSSIKQLAEDLNNRGMTLKYRTEAVVRYVRHLADDFQRVFTHLKRSDSRGSSHKD